MENICVRVAGVSTQTWFLGTVHPPTHLAISASTTYLFAARVEEVFKFDDITVFQSPHNL